MKSFVRFIVLAGTMFSWGASGSAQHENHGQENAKPDVAQPGTPARSEAQSSKRSNESDEEPRVAVAVPEVQQARMGLKTSPVTRKNIESVIRTVGTVAVDQTKEAHVHTRVNGWVEKVYADSIGKPVKKGEVLYELYSPELVSTQEEYISAGGHGDIGKQIASAALERLKLWDVPAAEIARLKSSKRVKRAISFMSPVNGVVIRKSAIQGMYVTPEMELYHISDISKVWIVATLYEHDMGVVKAGDDVQINLASDPANLVTAKIDYVYPEIDLVTRTGKARIIVNNPNEIFKPGMFVNVELKKSIGDSMIVPEDAVIDTGLRKITFVKTSATTFEPREVSVGPRYENHVVIQSGLSENDIVVTGAQFLIDAESKIQAALKSGKTSGGSHSGHDSKAK